MTDLGSGEERAAPGTDSCSHGKWVGIYGSSAAWYGQLLHVECVNCGVWGEEAHLLPKAAGH